MPITTRTGFMRPTFEEILAAQRAAYAREFGTGAEHPVLARLAELDAEAIHSIHEHIDHVATQAHPMLATLDGLLPDWGTVLVGAAKAATAAEGPYRHPGADGSTLTADSVLRRADGAEFTVAADGVVAAGFADVTIRARIAGKVGNSDTGVSLTLVSPVAGMDSAGTVQAPGLTGGHDAETEDQFRARILERLRTPPRGGNDADFIRWAKECAGVTAAWVRRGEAGSGEVVVLFMMHDTYATGIPVGDGSPNYSGDLKAVFDHIDAARPAPGVLYVKAPTPKVVDVEITGLSVDSPETRAAIEAELKDLFRRRAEPGKPLRWSWLAEAVSLAAGEDSFEAISPNATVVCATDEIAVLGAITYV